MRRAIPTGLSAVDRNLSLGGLPCGRVTQLVGRSGSGRTSFAIAVMAGLAGAGERSAVIDLAGDLDPAALIEAGLPSGWVWVVRPTRSKDALWAADLLLRSGHFRLVWLDGLEGGVSTAALVRLQRQARESESAVLVTADGRPLSAPGSLQLGFRALGVEWSEGLGGLAEPRRLRLAIEVGKGQAQALVGFECRGPRHLGQHELVADRRPAKWTEAKRPYAEPWEGGGEDALAAEVFGSVRRGPRAVAPDSRGELPRDNAA